MSHLLPENMKKTWYLSSLSFTFELEKPTEIKREKLFENLRKKIKESPLLTIQGENGKERSNQWLTL